MNVLDLFSGIGGFSLGLERAGMKTVAFCEVDKKAQLVLKKHWPEVPIFDDVRTLTKEKLDERNITVDLICGGFPCQDISLAGKGAGIEGERSGLWTEYARIIGEIRPSYVIVENVSALLGRGLDRVLRDLAQIGYDAEWHCIPASAVGAPHRRDRIWIVGYPNSSKWRMQDDRNLDWSLLDQAKWQKISNQAFGSSAKNAQTLAYPNCKGLERQREISSGISEELKDFSLSRWWHVEPAVGRVANGVPRRMDRLKQLGNAVVPQIPELIGRAIMKKTPLGSGHQEGQSVHQGGNTL